MILPDQRKVTIYGRNPLFVMEERNMHASIVMNVKFSIEVMKDNLYEAGDDTNKPERVHYSKCHQVVSA